MITAVKDESVVQYIFLLQNLMNIQPTINGFYAVID